MIDVWHFPEHGVIPDDFHETDWVKYSDHLESRKRLELLIYKLRDTVSGALVEELERELGNNSYKHEWGDVMVHGSSVRFIRDEGNNE